MRIVLLGPPGAGKGTQARLLSERKNAPQIATGDILRQAVREGTELGKKAQSYMTAGALVPDSVVVGIIRDRLVQDDCSEGFILDGFPRTVPQALSLNETLQGLGIALDRVVSVEVADEELIKRLSGRRVCGSCEKMYHVDFNPPKQQGICDACGGELVQRVDDQEATIRERLKVYADQTAPLIDFYSERGQLSRVDGTGSIDDILDRIEEVL